jgi:uncharacterized oligopeptide transporter (OPT) family protein
MLVGIRVLGETNNGPISAMANALQALFAVFWPTHIGLNLIAAGMAGNTSAQSEGTIQDFKTGKIIGSTPRILTYVQLAAVPIGAAAVAIMPQHFSRCRRHSRLDLDETLSPHTIGTISPLRLE